MPIAEAADHHPDILINYKRVTLTYSTHSEGGLTEKDFEGAAAADRQLPRCDSSAPTARARWRRSPDSARGSCSCGTRADCSRRRFRRTEPPPAATPNAATRRSSSSSCWCSPICGAAGFTVPQLHTIVDVLDEQIRLRLFEATGGGGTVQLLTDGERDLCAHGDGRVLQPAGAPAQPLLVIGNEGLLKELSGKVRARRKERDG